MTKIFSVFCLRPILVKSGSTGDEFQSIYLTVAAKPSYAKVDLVIAMSVAMAYIKKSRGTYSAVEYSFDTEDKLNGNCMG